MSKQSDPSNVDDNLQHLYESFRTRLVATLEEANRECAKWLPDGAVLKVFEGYRSTLRQQWLYTQGRTRPGSIVTNNRIPDHHGHGLAADVVWFDKHGEPSWDGAESLWAQLGHCGRAQQLEWGGDWPGRLGDVYHIQANHADLHNWQDAADKYLHSLGLTTP
jgi:peptidoglycan L-alanyl-D-glutamate endopeptidase CwlK